MAYWGSITTAWNALHWDKCWCKWAFWFMMSIKVLSSARAHNIDLQMWTRHEEKTIVQRTTEGISQTISHILDIEKAHCYRPMLASFCWGNFAPNKRPADINQKRENIHPGWHSWRARHKNFFFTTMLIWSNSRLFRPAAYQSWVKWKSQRMVIRVTSNVRLVSSFFV